MPHVVALFPLHDTLANDLSRECDRKMKWPILRQHVGKRWGWRKAQRDGKRQGRLAVWPVFGLFMDGLQMQGCKSHPQMRKGGRDQSQKCGFYVYPHLQLFYPTQGPLAEKNGTHGIAAKALVFRCIASFLHMQEAPYTPVTNECDGEVFWLPGCPAGHRADPPRQEPSIPPHVEIAFTRSRPFQLVLFREHII